MPPFLYAQTADKKIFQKILQGFDCSVKPGIGAHFPKELPVRYAAAGLRRAIVAPP